MGGQWIELKNASWVADSGRFSIALAEGTLDVVEPYPDGCHVAVGAITDISPWNHALPRERKPK
jgi:hypothetical protein